MGRRPSAVSFFFPVYRDEPTVRLVAEKALLLLRSLELSAFEVIIVDDGSPDRAGEIADQLAREHPEIRVIHHGRNRGYGAAIRTGLESSRYDSIWFTDGDDQFEVEDFRRLLRVADGYDLVMSFRFRKIYRWRRILISWVYNRLVNFIFGTNFRDVSTAVRIVRRDVVRSLDLVSDSPFIGAELAVKAILNGYRVGEVGVQTFERVNGPGSATSFKNIAATIKELLRLRAIVFSDTYQLPTTRSRGSSTLRAGAPGEDVRDMATRANVSSR